MAESLQIEFHLSQIIAIREQIKELEQRQLIHYQAVDRLREDRIKDLGVE